LTNELSDVRPTCSAVKAWPGGNVFLKLRGPEKTVTGADKPFGKLLDCLKKC
jgi:hypothetical protein